MHSAFVVVLLVGLSQALPPVPQEVHQESRTGRKAFCSLCTSLIQVLESMLNSEIDDLGELAEKACDQVSGGSDILEQVCKGWIQDELKTVEDDIKQQAPPKKICQKIDLC